MSPFGGEDAEVGVSGMLTGLLRLSEGSFMDVGLRSSLCVSPAG